MSVFLAFSAAICSGVFSEHAQSPKDSAESRKIAINLKVKFSCIIFKNFI